MSEWLWQLLGFPDGKRRNILFSFKEAGKVCKELKSGWLFFRPWTNNRASPPGSYLQTWEVKKKRGLWTGLSENRLCLDNFIVFWDDLAGKSSWGLLPVLKQDLWRGLTGLCADWRDGDWTGGLWGCSRRWTLLSEDKGEQWDGNRKVKKTKNAEKQILSGFKVQFFTTGMTDYWNSFRISLERLKAGLGEILCNKI